MIECSYYMEDLDSRELPRRFLEAFAAILSHSNYAPLLDAASRGAVDGIAESARSVGAAAQHGVPASLVGKLPAEFKMLGFDTHSQFDILAADAEKLGDPTHSLQQLAGLMRNCVACHAAYRSDLTGP